MYLFIIFSVGFAAGAINTLASGGTALTLPILMALGIPGHIANASNRVGLLVSGITRVTVFHRAGKIDWGHTWKLVAPMALGALAGALIEHQIPESSMRWVILAAVLLTLGLVGLGRKRFLEVKQREHPDLRISKLSVFFLMRIWAGFLAVDSGGMALWAIVVLVGIETVKANALKGVLTLVTSLISVITMGFEHQIDWELGITLAAGSMIGSWITAKFAVTEGARVWIFRLLMIMLAAEVLWILLSVMQ
ncbi:MAG: TSUP family transporter [Desulfobacterales bacterium]|nr:TSUP family transporter [Desulfobacterales bacterium]